MPGKSGDELREEATAADEARDTEGRKADDLREAAENADASEEAQDRAENEGGDED